MRLRIIAGSLGGRFFDAPGTDTTHPMSERMRGALFNIMGDVAGLHVFDAFAGSGALSFEAISRGAASALLLERDKRAQNVIQKNIEQLGLASKATLIKANCRTWSEHNKDKLFDLVVVDPPYHDMQLSTVDILSYHLKPNALMVVSYSGRGSVPTVKGNGVVVVDNRDYGDAALAFYRQRAPQ